jgi:hypothetical protein
MGGTPLVGTFRSARGLPLLYASRKFTCVVALEIGFEVGGTC